MKISTLRIDCGNNGRTIVEVRADCHSVEDVDTLIAWLEMANVVMNSWEAINAETSRPAKAAASKDEASQPGKVQGQS